jgi:hypothetical protein
LSVQKVLLRPFLCQFRHQQPREEDPINLFVMGWCPVAFDAYHWLSTYMWLYC